MTDYFFLLDEPRRPWLEPEAVRAKFLFLSAATHPDRVHAGGAAATGPAADRFASLRRHLDTLGTPIGPYDLQIAAIALVNGCTLITHNTREFSRVPGLLLEDWELP